jgi:hypothetical protein
MKIKSLGAVLANRFQVGAARDLVPSHPTLGDVDSRRALDDYQAAKREHKLAVRGKSLTAAKPAGSRRSGSIAPRRSTGG